MKLGRNVISDLLDYVAKQQSSTLDETIQISSNDISNIFRSWRYKSSWGPEGGWIALGGQQDSERTIQKEIYFS